MAYKLTISNIIRVPVRFSLNDCGKEKEFSVTLLCERLDAEETKKRESGGDTLVSDFMRGVVRGWEDQTLVVDDNDKPAEFNAAALDVLLGVKGLANVLYVAYLKECRAREKN